jgi:hypothetical protein
MMNLRFYKYPRTPHIEGSCQQQGDEDLNLISFSMLANKEVIITEKVDGANVGISFNHSGQLLLQSRGHYLTGGYRERQFNLFKQWAYSHSLALAKVLGIRYILYGEWLYAKHTIFYNNLPHYFLAFDLFDQQNQEFLATEIRQDLLRDFSLTFVPILFKGKLKSPQQLTALITQSNFIREGHLEQLRIMGRERNLNESLILQQTDPSILREGLYIKVEEKGIVQHRYKYVRQSFSNTILSGDTHWLNRPIIPNLLAVEPSSLFGN